MVKTLPKENLKVLSRYDTFMCILGDNFNVCLDMQHSVGVDC